MVGIFGGDALRSLAAAMPAEQVERIEALDTAAASVAEMKPAQPKPLRLKVNRYEGKEGENLHFWVREVELAMDADLISIERLRVWPYPTWEVGRRPGRTRARRQLRVASQSGLSCVNSLEPPSFRRTMSIASTSASLPVNEGSVSCTNTSKRSEYSLHLW
ncbi:Gag protein [Phytophthora palmivora]|uniref:Gag protein n=1 Tax=Phytophthora palmivora TaxID=4796 RepID=A0A2P4Y597_9STRA|nr:Gag protein [Phytophthora palmivora]